MRRTALALTALAAGIAGTFVAVAPAQAADPATVVSRQGLPEDFVAQGSSCTGADAPDAYSHKSIDFPEGRYGVLEIASTSGTPVSFVGLVVDDVTAPNQSMEVAASTPSGLPTEAEATVLADDGVYVGTTTIPTARTEAFHQLLQDVGYDWTFYPNDPSSSSQHVGVLPVSSLGVTDALGVIGLASVSCTGEEGLSSVVHVNDWWFGATQYDFTAPLAPWLTSRTDMTFTPGASLRLSVEYAEDTGPLPGVQLELWARPAGATTFTRLTTAVTNAYGRAAATVYPKHRTVYEWRSAAHGDWAPGVLSLTAKARSTASLALSRTAVRKGQRMYAYGHVSPAVGQTVNVYRNYGSRLLKLGTFTVNSKGNYRVYFAPKSSGTWRIVARVSARGGYATGQSTTKKLTVR